MVFRYFSESDMLYIELAPGVAVESEEVAPRIVLDYDDAGRVIGIEIEDAGSLVDLTHLELAALPLVNLILQPAVAPAS